MVYKNQFVEEKHKLIRECNGTPTEEQLKRIEELDEKSREFVNILLNELEEKQGTIHEEVLEVPKEHISIYKQYKKVCALYKQANRLLLDIREAKKLIREEMAERREKMKFKYICFSCGYKTNFIDDNCGCHSKLLHNDLQDEV